MGRASVSNIGITNNPSAELHPSDAELRAFAIGILAELRAAPRRAAT